MHPEKGELLESTILTSNHVNQPEEQQEDRVPVVPSELDITPRNSFIEMLKSSSFIKGGSDGDEGGRTPRFSIHSNCSADLLDLALKLSAPPSVRNSLLLTEHDPQGALTDQSPRDEVSHSVTKAVTGIESIELGGSFYGEEV